MIIKFNHDNEKCLKIQTLKRMETLWKEETWRKRKLLHEDHFNAVVNLKGSNSLGNMSSHHPDPSNPQSQDQPQQPQISPHRQHHAMAQDLPPFVMPSQELPPLIPQQDLHVHHQDIQSKQQQTKPRKKDSYESTVVSSGSRITRFKQLSTRYLEVKFYLLAWEVDQ